MSVMLSRHDFARDPKTRSRGSLPDNTQRTA